MGVGGNRGGGGWRWVAVIGVGIDAAWLSTWFDLPPTPPPMKEKKVCLKWFRMA